MRVASDGKKFRLRTAVAMGKLGRLVESANEVRREIFGICYSTGRADTHTTDPRRPSIGSSDCVQRFDQVAPRV